MEDENFSRAVLEILRQILEEMRKPQRGLALQQEMLDQLRILTASETFSSISPIPERPMMNREQVKKFLQIEETTYKRKVRKGELKPMKMPGGHRYYKEDLLDAYQESIRRGRI